MKRKDLEHLIRASADLADDDEIIVIGSQSVLAQHPDAPSALTVSNQADVYPKNHPERWELIDGSIGEGSPFHDTFGYYAQGVEEGTAVLLRAAVAHGLLEHGTLLARVPGLPLGAVEQARVVDAIAADFAGA